MQRMTIITDYQWQLYMASNLMIKAGPKWAGPAFGGTDEHF